MALRCYRTRTTSGYLVRAFSPHPNRLWRLQIPAKRYTQSALRGRLLKRLIAFHHRLKAEVSGEAIKDFDKYLMREQK